MTGKLLILFACAAIGTAGGYAVLLSYKRKLCYLDGMCRIIGELKNSVSFKRDSATKTLLSFETESALLKKNVAEYVEFAGGKSDAPTISRGFLSAEVYGRVCEFFSSIGKTDESAQSRQLDYFGDQFEKLRAGAEQKYNEFGTVAVKLGFLLGAGAGVLAL